MGIEDILRQNDQKRSHGDARQNAYERGLQARSAFAEFVGTALVAAIWGLKDSALGEPERLPIAAKSSETGVFIECQGLVRFTVHCVVRADEQGVAYCSVIDLGMSRGGRIVRGTFEPVHGTAGLRAHKLGYTDKQFEIDRAKLLKTIETLAHQL